MREELKLALFESQRRIENCRFLLSRSDVCPEGELRSRLWRLLLEEQLQLQSLHEQAAAAPGNESGAER